MVSSHLRRHHAHHECAVIMITAQGMLKVDKEDWLPEGKNKETEMMEEERRRAEEEDSPRKPPTAPPEREVVIHCPPKPHFEWLIDHSKRKEIESTDQIGLLTMDDSGIGMEEESFVENEIFEEEDLNENSEEVLKLQSQKITLFMSDHLESNPGILSQKATSLLSEHFEGKVKTEKEESDSFLDHGNESIHVSPTNASQNINEEKENFLAKNFMLMPKNSSIDKIKTKKQTKKNRDLHRKTLSCLLRQTPSPIKFKISKKTVYDCNECSVKFPTREELIVHVGKTHILDSLKYLIEESLPYKCPINKMCKLRGTIKSKDCVVNHILYTKEKHHSDFVIEICGDICPNISFENQGVFKVNSFEIQEREPLKISVQYSNVPSIKDISKKRKAKKEDLISDPDWVEKFENRTRQIIKRHRRSQSQKI